MFAQRALASVFHPGEQQVQVRTGTREFVKNSGYEDFMRAQMPAQHRDFFQNQPLLYLGSKDKQGRPWATVIIGRPGFVQTPDAQHLEIKPLRLSRADPLAGSLGPGSHIGMLGIELHTRRRNRLNGVVVAAASETLPQQQGLADQVPETCPANDASSLSIDVSLSFGNCPKYIQGRQLDIDYDTLDQRFAGPSGQEDRAIGTQGTEAVTGGALLGLEQRRIVKRADTFFISSCFDGPVPPDVKDAAVGCDMSHRGGPTGFVKLLQLPDSTVLRWADYVGNNMFQTLGNLMTNARAGLLFIDFQTGDTLHLTGKATVDFDDRSLPGAQRTVSFTVESFVHIQRSLPLKQLGPTDFSPFLPEGDDADDLQHDEDLVSDVARQPDQAATWRPPRVQQVECVSVTRETHDITTFEFKLPVAHDGTANGTATPYLPGQYATFEFPAADLASAARAAGIRAGGSPVVRTWTVSSHPSWSAASGTFTISVKRAGLVSGHLHAAMRTGATVALRTFGGEFTPSKQRAGLPGSTVLLLAGGIGVTPMRAMFHDFLLTAAAAAARPPAAVAAAGPAHVVLLYAVRRLEDAAFMDEFVAASNASAAASAAAGGGAPPPPQVRLVLALSQGSAEELAAARARWPGPNVAVVAGRVGRQLLLEHSGASAADGAGVGALDAVSAAYMCGPPSFMAALEGELRALGLDMARLHQESFSF